MTTLTDAERDIVIVALCDAIEFNERNYKQGIARHKGKWNLEHSESVLKLIRQMEELEHKLIPK